MRSSPKHISSALVPERSQADPSDMSAWVRLPPRLSAIVITKNEAGNIAECLDSLGFCDELVVVDCGSEDDTVRIARDRGAQVYHRDWSGYGSQKNFALSAARGEWVLSVDADERVGPELAQEIKGAVAVADADGYEFPRLSTFCGRSMRHSGWHPDYVLRLFRRTRGRFTDDLVHEHVVCRGPVRRIGGVLLHYPVHRLEDALSRIDRYSTLGAQQLAASGRRVSFATGLVRGCLAFLRSFVLRAGFLDGREGLMLAIANAEGTYYRYMKAWLATRAEPASRSATARAATPATNVPHLDASSHLGSG